MPASYWEENEVIQNLFSSIDAGDVKRLKEILSQIDLNSTCSYSKEYYDDTVETITEILYKKCVSRIFDRFNDDNKSESELLFLTTYSNVDSNLQLKIFNEALKFCLSGGGSETIAKFLAKIVIETLDSRLLAIYQAKVEEADEYLEELEFSKHYNEKLKNIISANIMNPPETMTKKFLFFSWKVKNSFRTDFLESDICELYCLRVMAEYLGPDSKKI